MQKIKDRDVEQYIQRIDEKNTHGWHVLIDKNSKLFVDSINGGKQQAKTKAVEYANSLHMHLFGTEIPAKASHLRIVK